MKENINNKIMTNQEKEELLIHYTNWLDEQSYLRSDLYSFRYNEDREIINLELVEDYLDK